MKKPTLRLVRKDVNKQIDMKVKLKRTPMNTDSIIFALTKKMTNNACKIATIKTSDSKKIDLLVMNDLIIYNKKKNNNKKKCLVNTSKNKIDPKEISLERLRKYFLSPNYIVESVPELIINFKNKPSETILISSILDLEYTEEAIETFIRKVLKRIEASQKSRD